MKKTICLIEVVYQNKSSPFLHNLYHYPFYILLWKI